MRVHFYLKFKPFKRLYHLNPKSWMFFVAKFDPFYSTKTLRWTDSKFLKKYFEKINKYIYIINRYIRHSTIDTQVICCSENQYFKSYRSPNFLNNSLLQVSIFPIPKIW